MDVHDWLNLKTWSSDETLCLGCEKRVLGMCQAKAFHPLVLIFLEHIICLGFLRGEGEI